MTTPTRSGFSALVFNFRERIVSDDQNRAHQFTAQAVAELLRRAHLSTASSATAGGKTTVASAVANPLAGLVFEGIRFRPELGTVNAFVEPGVLAVASPEADPHPADSPARLISSAGIQTIGPLFLTPGPAATRIDVVECQPLQQVVETDSRDIFDPTTGLFAPASVNKVVQTGLAFRIRVGVDGGGFPGTASGWLPIAVCSVPSGATTWNDATVWDVRPLLADLASPPGAVSQSFGAIRRASGVAANNGAGSWRARGLFEGELSGFVAGGELASSSSGLAFLDLALAANQEPGFAIVNNALWFLYLAQPFGLPRWCALNPSSTGNRDPGSLRGIPVFTQAKPPEGLSGRPASALALPTATGLAGSTTNALLALSGFFVVANFESTVVARGMASHLAAPTLAPSAGAGTATVTYSLAPNDKVPASAVELRAVFAATLTDTPGLVYSTSIDVTVRDSAGLNVATFSRSGASDVVPAAGALGIRFEMTIPIPPSYPGGGTQTFSVVVAYSTGAVGAPVYSGQLMTVRGWRLGA